MKIFVVFLSLSISFIRRSSLISLTSLIFFLQTYLLQFTSKWCRTKPQLLLLFDLEYFINETNEKMDSMTIRCSFQFPMLNWKCIEKNSYRILKICGERDGKDSGPCGSQQDEWTTQTLHVEICPGMSYDSWQVINFDEELNWFIQFSKWSNDEKKRASGPDNETSHTLSLSLDQDRKKISPLHYSQPELIKTEK